MIVVNVVKMTALFNMFKVTKMTGLMIGQRSQKGGFGGFS